MITTYANGLRVGFFWILCLLLIPNIFAQNISGTVSSADGEALQGATITVQGSTVGTLSDASGKYELELPNGATTLVVSYVGYQTQRLAINNRSTVNVSMVEEVTSLDEVVVVGYGTVKKSDLTGSISSMKEDDFNQGANISVDQLIIGRAAGVQVTQTSSEPGGGLSIRVRGANSITAGNEPLYVIDGLPVDNSNLIAGGGGAGVGNTIRSRNPLNSLNPADIESIEILKDASATAIYGARGANGVVMITTKKGTVGRTSVNYDAYYGHQLEPERLDILSTDEYIEIMNDIARQEIGVDPLFSGADISRIGAGVDWQDEIFQAAPMQNHNLSVSGGNAATSYYASFNYFDQEGILRETGVRRFGGRLNLAHEVGKFKINVNMNTSVNFDDFALDNSATNEGSGPIYSAILYDPTEPIFDANGNGGFNHSTELTVNNPVSLVDGIDAKGQTNRTFGNVTLDYEIIDGLSAKLNLGSDRQFVRRDLYNTRSTFRGSSSGGIANIRTLERTNYLAEYTMNYSRDFNESNSMVVLGGITYQDFQNRTFDATIQGFPSDATGTDNLGLGDTGADDVSSNRQGNTLLSYLGRVNFTLANKFLITASVRADGSSRFGANNKYGVFPSFAFAWKLDEENFLPEDVDLKLRASWGQTGNQEIGNFASLSTFTTGGDAILNNSIFSGTQPSRIANPDLRWETTTQTNIGFDYGFLGGRINGTLDLFLKQTTDLLLSLPLPASSGFGSILTNAGAMENRGIEFLMNTTNINSGDFLWTTSFNISAISNQATDLGGLDDIRTGGLANVGNSVVIQPGSPIFSYFGYEITGIFQTQEEVDGSAQPSSQPGYPIFKDQNNDGAITPDDQVILGKPFPDFTLGLGNNISFKGFTLDFFIQAVQGIETVNVQAIESMYPANFRRNKFRKQFLDRWTPDNPNATFPSGVKPSAYGGGKVNSLTIEDASFIRLRTITLSYDFATQNSKVFNNARIYVTGQNLLTIDDYIGWDPEASLRGTGNLRADQNSYPLTRTLIFGVNLGF
ncbi:MAG: TonB-dependent receptor [Bacteroidota bacterium]